jgi:hypothetical protein
MKKTTKAVLFSLLIFPGAGHFLLRQWPWGLFYIAGTLSSSAILVNHGYNKAMDVMDRVLSGEVALEPEAIEALMNEKSSPEEELLLNAAQLLLLTCWLGSAAHSYAEAAAIEKQQS